MPVSSYFWSMVLVALSSSAFWPMVLGTLSGAAFGALLCHLMFDAFRE